jgi:hypothetical protein
MFRTREQFVSILEHARPVCEILSGQEGHKDVVLACAPQFDL